MPPTNPNILFSEFPGDVSIYSETVSDACLIQVFKELLKKFYPTTTFPSIVQVIRYCLYLLIKTYFKSIKFKQTFKRSKWHSDPLIQGSYTYVPLGGSVSDIKNLATPIVRNLKFYFLKI